MKFHDGTTHGDRGNGQKAKVDGFVHGVQLCCELWGCAAIELKRSCDGKFGWTVEMNDLPALMWQDKGSKDIIALREGHEWTYVIVLW